MPRTAGITAIFLRLPVVISVWTSPMFTGNTLGNGRLDPLFTDYLSGPASSPEPRETEWCCSEFSSMLDHP